MLEKKYNYFGVKNKYIYKTEPIYDYDFKLVLYQKKLRNINYSLLEEENQ